MRFHALLLGLCLAAGCKPDPTESAPAASGHDTRTRPRSGMIDRPELAKTPDERERRKERREERRRAREEEMDSDGDGTVSEAERAADRMQRAVTMHGRLDLDHDGKLSPAELGGTPFGRRYNVATIDLDHDGDVSPQELVTAMETYLPPARRHKAFDE